MPAPEARSANNTKLIATLGPASAERGQLAGMLQAGLDACRLNFSHGTPQERERALQLVRRVAAERGEPIAVIGDLSGSKIRLGRVRGGSFRLQAGQTVRIVAQQEECTRQHLATNYPELTSQVAVGQRIYLDDGLVRLLVTERSDDELICRCTAGGTVSSHKGVNLPDTRLSRPALTDKDRRDLDWAVAHELDYVALSFVRRPDDLRELRALLAERGSSLGVITKIEKAEALEHLDELVATSDAVLVARGDLGVELDIWEVPVIQKEITARCRAAGVPVVIATQMLQSMISSPVPTRAEVSDVANAVLDAADALLLSGETAIGRYPVQAVSMMNRIAQVTEAHLRQSAVSAGLSRRRPPAAPPTAALAHAAVQAARDLDARAVAVWSADGAAVRLVAQHRLPMPVVGLTSDERAWRRMNLLYGVRPIRLGAVGTPAELAEALDARLIEGGLVEPGELVVVMTAAQPGAPPASETVVVHRVARRPA